MEQEKWSFAQFLFWSKYFKIKNNNQHWKQNNQLSENMAIFDYRAQLLKIAALSFKSSIN